MQEQTTKTIGKEKVISEDDFWKKLTFPFRFIFFSLFSVGGYCLVEKLSILVASQFHSTFTINILGTDISMSYSFLASKICIVYGTFLILNVGWRIFIPDLEKFWFIK